MSEQEMEIVDLTEETETDAWQFWQTEEEYTTYAYHEQAESFVYEPNEEEEMEQDMILDNALFMLENPAVEIPEPVTKVRKYRCF